LRVSENNYLVSEFLFFGVNPLLNREFGYSAQGTYHPEKITLLKYVHMNSLGKTTKEQSRILRKRL